MATPELRLEQHTDLGNDESHVYGHRHEFIYVSGEMTEPRTFRAVIVGVNVGGGLYHEDPTGRVAVRGALVHAGEGNNGVLEANYILQEDPSIELVGEIALTVANAVLRRATTPVKELNQQS